MLQIFPESNFQLASELFAFATNDENASRMINITLTKIPQFADIVTNKSGAFEEVESFTQQDIDDGNIWIQQVGGY